jgi:transient receptor potential cation channel subfamily C protein 6
MLAAQYNRTEIVQILLINGDRITKPHDFNCKCTECLNKFKFDSLRHAQSRLNAYRGLASEAYISLASIDPILTAFYLSHELGILAQKEKYFKHEYLQLRNSLSTYSVKLLNNVRGRDELDIVLNKTGKEREEKSEKLARLDLAVRFQEKPFVAHSNCQQKLIETWYSGVRKITKMNPAIIVVLILSHIVFLPFSSAIYIVAPRSKIGKFIQLPCVKFISHFASYLVFITLIIVSILDYPSQFATNEKLSESYTEFYENYTFYLNRKDISFKPLFNDLIIRPSNPTNLGK